MASLVAVTERIKLFASVAVLNLPLAMVVRTAVTIESIALSRFDVNIVLGRVKDERAQQNLWSANEYFGYPYDYLIEFVRVMNSQSDFKGEPFTVNDCCYGRRPKFGLVAADQRDVDTAITGSCLANESRDHTQRQWHYADLRRFVQGIEKFGAESSR